MSMGSLVCQRLRQRLNTYRAAIVHLKKKSVLLRHEGAGIVLPQPSILFISAVVLLCGQLSCRTLNEIDKGHGDGMLLVIHIFEPRGLVAEVQNVSAL